jgi:cell division protein FtsZ
MCDDILKSAVEGISDLITTPGVINIDFADIRAVMHNAGPALMGIGYASGEKRAEEAARMAINSPLLEVSINGAKGVLFSIAGGDDLTMFEIQDAAKVITESVDPDARIIFGTVRDEKLKKGEVKITVIASSFPESQSRKTLFGTDVREISTPSSTDREDRMNEGKIYNALPSNPKPIAPQVQQIVVEAEPKKLEVTESEDDEWGAVPAFLRRSRLK